MVETPFYSLCRNKIKVNEVFRLLPLFIRCANPVDVTDDSQIVAANHTQRYHVERNE